MCIYVFIYVLCIYTWVSLSICIYIYIYIYINDDKFVNKESVIKKRRKTWGIETTNASKVLPKVQKQTKNIIYWNNIPQNCLLMLLIVLLLRKGWQSDKIRKPDTHFSVWVTEKTLLSPRPTYFFGFLIVMPNIEGLLCFIHPYNYLSFNILCWEDHEALMERFSGLVRWQYPSRSSC